MFDLVTNNDEDCFRAYSMASFPLEDDIIMLNIRIAPSELIITEYAQATCAIYNW